MERRKTICVITSQPEHFQAQRVFDGVFTQCEKYGYNVAVFASMTSLQFHLKDQVLGDKNIYNLINYSFFDGIILDTINLVADEKDDLTGRLIGEYKAQGCKAPMISISMPCYDLPVVSSRNEPVLREMCRHAIEFHGCKNICLLTGFKGHHEAEERLAVFIDEVKKHGLDISEDHIVYGDFWYTGGEKLADDIIEGRVSKPDCVICASDHMALGLIDKLEGSGFSIPDDMVVIGFEGTAEAAIANKSLTSYESNFTQSAANAVDEIRKIIDPGAQILPYETDVKKMIHRGMSCGCPPDFTLSSKFFRKSLYTTVRNYNQGTMIESIDIGLLMENYVLEQLTDSSTPDECLKKIEGNAYMLMPYENFYMCLRDDWLDTEADTVVGYPEKMRIVIAGNESGHGFSSSESEKKQFDTKLMIPHMHDYTESPSVFYFSAVHFSEKMLGYMVLQRTLDNNIHMDLVYRNWLRIVNNSLEMVRTKYRYVMLSIYDKLTGVYNRHGMFDGLKKLSQNASDEDLMLVTVIDMDGLKYINDTFGHNEGDFGIITVSKAASEIAGENGICVRAGGDEFFVINVGRYTEASEKETEERFLNTLNRLSAGSGKPYDIRASVGCCLSRLGGKLVVEEALSVADHKMYARKQQYKAEHRRERGER
ncbi:MAG: GGDEF domain-containing protein [Ruminococcus sp.]|nr:GGDEF domain-containing protein [Ruminococcus sp.]